MSTAVDYPHLTVESDGSVRISGSRYRVLHLAGEHYHYGWTAEELLRQHADLRPEEIYAALTYFYDHYPEMVAALAGGPSSAGPAPRVSAVPRAELLRRRENGVR